VWLRGNGERWSARPDDAPDNGTVQGAIAACREELGAFAVRRLGALPEQAVIDGVRFCHASPISDVRSFPPAPDAQDEELIGGTVEPLLVFGHTHLPFARSGPGGLRLCNPGSVGMPFDGDQRAAYALLDGAGRVEHRRVEYDYAATARALRDRATPWSEVVAGRIERAAF
jgi:diadenosine tetraphosphatase ApaH/serine/threonine PP2A family protein phosphatase